MCHVIQLQLQNEKIIINIRHDIFFECHYEQQKILVPSWKTRNNKM